MIETQLVTIGLTADYIKERFSGESSGHDWWHTYRVYESGKQIAYEEGAELYVVELASLLHDIADFKFHDGDEDIGPRLAEEWLKSLGVEQDVITHVKNIVATISFKGANTKNEIKTLEGMCVQDADRLDAIGAIGIARAFAFGGARGNPIYDPNVPTNVEQSKEEYKKSNNPEINHFYEKLLLLKDRMNTDTAREMAEERHKFMEQFLQQFFKEWGLECPS